MNQNRRRSRLASASRAAALLVGVLALSHAAHTEVPTAPAAFKPAGPFTNLYAPFQPGAVKVSAGREGGQATMEIEYHRLETRAFWLGEELVECAVIEEQEFVAGMLVDASTNFLGEDVDGNVYYFGEISTAYAEGVPIGTEGSWLVGGATLPDDPADALAVEAPFLYMPAHPEVGDTFEPEVLPGDEETVTVLAVDVKLQTSLGKFGNVLKVRETSVSDDEPETHWIVPGLGRVKARSKGESLKLRATTLLPAGA